MDKEPNYAAWGIVAFLGLCILTAGGMVGCPHYSVYRQRLEGAALLAHAQSAKEVAVAEAKAKMESAELLAQAEVARARGVAQAIDVAGAGTDKTVVYVPTEGNMPILEAARFMQGAKPK